MAYLDQLLLQGFSPSQLRGGSLLRLAEFTLRQLQFTLQIVPLSAGGFQLICNSLALLSRAINLAVSTILNAAHIGLLRDTLLLGLESQRLQFLLQFLIVLLGIAPFEQLHVTMLLQLPPGYRHLAVRVRRDQD